MSMQEDILAARYFKNGETKREEVYHRVADFIGDSQKERDTYFNMMQNDEFLPNSPTLMNAGANPEPFMSACVVLPVEDKMEDIFNSVKNAAVCHQRGAGCIAEGSVVFTKNGPVKIDDIKRGDEVWSINSKNGKQSYCKVTETHVYTTDDKNILMVMFEGKGNYTVTSDYHPFTVLKDGKYTFVEAKDLKEGDEVIYGNTAKPSTIKFGKTAYKEGMKYAEEDAEIPAPKTYTDSYILSYLAGIFKNLDYEIFAADFNGTFEEYVTRLNLSAGDSAMVFVYNTKYASNIELIGSLLSKMGIKFGYSFKDGMFVLTILIQYKTTGHKMLTFMYEGIPYDSEGEISANNLRVLAVTEGKCNRLRDLTVEGNNTYFAGTSGALCFIHNTGFSFNDLRAHGALVHSSQGKASGPVSFMQVFDKATSVVSQGGSRRGANMGILRVDHPDILKFIKCKEIEGDIQNFNISVMVTDEFMDYVRREKMDYVMSTDMDGHDNTVGEIWKSLVEHTWKNGEPGILFYDAINRDNTVKHIGNIHSTNPCGEQPLLPYESCTLGSINLSKFVYDNMSYPANPRVRDVLKYDKFVDVIRQSVDFLDKVVSKNVFPLNELKEAADKTRKIGLGLMGVHDAMIKLGIQYDSQDAVDFIDGVMEIVHSIALEESHNLALKYGAFPEYHDNALLEEFPYANHPRKFVPMWNKYIAEGKIVRNASITTEAPTGTISLLANCSSGIEPVFSYVYKRKNVVGNEYMVIHPIFESRMHELFDDNTCDRIFEHMYEKGTIQDMEDIPITVRKIFKTALDIEPFWHIKIQATFQSWVMSSISKTINMPEETTVEEIGDALLLAHSLGCKGLTIYRTNSRQNVVLSLKDTKSESNTSVCSESSNHDNVEQVIFERGGTLSGRTYTIQSGCCKLYVTINHDDDGTIREVFVQNSGAGGCSALLGALGRMVSLNLQEARDVAEFNRVVRSLSKITCPACVKNPYAQSKSCSDSVARCMKKEAEYLQAIARKEFVQDLILPEINLKEISEQLVDVKETVKEINKPTKNILKDDTWTCPECGAENHGIQGCKTCKECGFSRCG